MIPATVAPLILPSGLALPDGRMLVFPPCRECECADCVDAFAAYNAGVLDYGADR